MNYTYRTTGVCASSISFDITDGIVKNVVFNGGCPGNQLGIASLVQGQNVDDVIARLSGIRCGGKPTSCPDQLARALATAKAEMQK